MTQPPKSISEALNIAYRFLSYRPRTVKQTRIHLQKKGTAPPVIDAVIKDLLEKRFLDDDHFTRLFLEEKTRISPKAKFALGYELRQKGVNGATIETHLEEYDDELLAQKAVLSKTRQWQQVTPQKLDQKIMNFLRYRGFDYRTVCSALHFFHHLKDNDNEN